MKLLNLLSLVMDDDSLVPQVIPLADGGVQAEWHRNGRDLELVVHASTDPTFYFFDVATGTEEEDSMTARTLHFQTLLASMS